MISNDSIKIYIELKSALKSFQRISFGQNKSSRIDTTPCVSSRHDMGIGELVKMHNGLKQNNDAERSYHIITDPADDGRQEHGLIKDPLAAVDACPALLRQTSVPPTQLLIRQRAEVKVKHPAPSLVVIQGRNGDLLLPGVGEIG